MVQHAFPRSFKTNYIQAERGEGIYIVAKDGKKYIDGCSGALISNLGHAVPEIADAVASQCRKLEFAHPSRWQCDIVEEAATAIAEFAPEGLENVWLVSGGSEAIESAVKLARQSFYEMGGEYAGKYITIARWNSYHGSTLATVSLGGSMARRRPYFPMFLEMPKIQPHYCYRCPFGLEYPKCGMRCAYQLEHEIRRIGANYVSAFLAEPIVGSTVGALTPPDEYWPIVREICDKYDVVLIADEVMTGCGRTGENFCVDHWKVKPDIIATAKGLAAGYVPTGGIIANDKLLEPIKKGSGAFMHGHTYNGNPVSAAAVVAVMKYMKEHDVVGNVKRNEHIFKEGLEKIKAENPMVGDVRGKGYMWGVELVKDKAKKEPFEKTKGASGVATKACIEQGLIIYPGSGMIDGVEGDNFLLAPPLVTTEAQARQIVEMLAAGLASAAKQLL
ncbi:aminotransferase class III-fold pyridoxal phosphate-dependent enzyme [Synergistaceae bacterium OttesenSCG-928-I11]|nr:aminotransferase class III-fold pyridoxal phosphate-dependent enzyme [Synergistaceae bacterium OttesenSCG-928-I11]